MRLGPVDRVLYKFGDWASAPAELLTADGAVRLDGYRHQPPNTIEVLGITGDRIVLLIVPPHTEQDRAHATLMAAAGRGNSVTVDGLLMGSLQDAAQERWDSEGGAAR